MLMTRIVFGLMLPFFFGCASRAEVSIANERPCPVVADCLVEEAVLLQENGQFELARAAVALALRFDPEYDGAIGVAAEFDEFVLEQCHAYLLEARQQQLDRNYFAALRALYRAEDFDPENAAVRTFREITEDVIVGDAAMRPRQDEPATTERGTGMRWGVSYVSPVRTRSELKEAISSMIPQHGIWGYCERGSAESTDARIFVPHSQMPFSLDNAAWLRGRLFDEDESLGEVHWYAYSCNGVPIGPVWVYVVWRDVGEERWVLKRGLVKYDPDAAPRDYTGAAPVSDENDSFENVMWVATE